MRDNVKKLKKHIAVIYLSIKNDTDWIHYITFSIFGS